MNRPFPVQPRRRTLTLTTGLVLTASLLLAFLGTGCGGKDQDDAEIQAQADRPHSLVPANLDSLIEETGTSLVQEEVAEEPVGQLEVLEVKDTVAEQTPVVETVPAAKASVPVSSGGTFSLQVGSFRQQANAASLAQKVQKLGYPASIEMAEVGGLMYHRVFVRGQATRAQAEKLGEELRSELGINYLVLRHQ